MDIIGTNVQVNLGIRATSNDVDKLITQVKELKRVLSEFKGQKYDIDLSLDVNKVLGQIESLKKELKNLDVGSININIPTSELEKLRKSVDQVVSGSGTGRTSGGTPRPPIDKSPQRSEFEEIPALSKEAKRDIAEASSELDKIKAKLSGLVTDKGAKPPSSVAEASLIDNILGDLDPDTVDKKMIPPTARKDIVEVTGEISKLKSKLEKLTTDKKMMPAAAKKDAVEISNELDKLKSKLEKLTADKKMIPPTARKDIVEIAGDVDKLQSKLEKLSSKTIKIPKTIPESTEKPTSPLGDFIKSKGEKTPVSSMVTDAEELKKELFQIENQIEGMMGRLNRERVMRLLGQKETMGAGAKSIIPGISGQATPASLTETATITERKMDVGGVEQDVVQTMMKSSSVIQQINQGLLQRQKITEKIRQLEFEGGDTARDRLSHEVQSVQIDLQQEAQAKKAQADARRQVTETEKLAELERNRIASNKMINTLLHDGFERVKKTTEFMTLGGQQADPTTTRLTRGTGTDRETIDVSEKTGKATLVETDEKLEARIKMQQNANFQEQKDAKKLIDLKAKIKEMDKERARLRSFGFEQRGATEFKKLKIAGEELKVPIRDMVYEFQNGMEVVHKLNPLIKGIGITKQKNVEFAKREKAEAKEQLKIQQELARQERVKAGHAQFTRATSTGGFKVGQADQYANFATGKEGEIIRAHRAMRLGLAKYNVEVMTFNTLTGEMRTNMIQGAAASKFLGDSIFRAGEKIAIWTLGTTILFSAIRTVKGLADGIKYLEANTVFMARVSNRLVTSFKDEEDRFRQKLIMAEEITAKTIELTRVTGGLADEAQQSAVVFLRAGNDQQDVIYGVAASLMAARIAQLNITDSTNMLVSAMRQFRLETKEIIPTLDTLNELSNNYKVTTSDLMQAVGRTGSVFAAHNGTLAELASMTAVIAQRTSRTGAEVGNALKTLESRLDRTDSARKVFDRLAVSTRDFDGEARSLAKTVFELSLRMDDLNATDAQQLRIDIAGIRQVNFLVSALAEAEAQVIAMQRALINNNSAYSEFLESSLTLESSLERLKAHITSIAQGVRGPLGQMFTGLINSLNMLVSLISATSKITIVGPVVIASFWMLRNVIQRVSKALFNASGGFLNMGIATKQARWEMGMFNLRAKETQMSLGALTAGLFTKTGALKAATTAWVGIKGAMSAFLTVGNLATLGIGAILTAWTLYASRMRVRMDMLEEERVLIDLGISAEEKKVQAYLHTNWAMNMIHTRMLEINRSMKAGTLETEKYKEQMENLAKSARNMGELLGIETTGMFLDDDSKDKMRKEFADLISESFGRKKVWLEIDKEQTKGEVDKARAEIEKLFDPSEVFRRTGVPVSIHPGIDPSDPNRALPGRLLYEFDPHAKKLTEENIKEFEIFLHKKISEIDPGATLRKAGSTFPGVDEREALAVEELLQKIRSLGNQHDTFNKIVEEGTAKIIEWSKAIELAKDLETEEIANRFKILHEEITELNYTTDKLFDKHKKFGEILSATGQKKTYSALIGEYQEINNQLKPLTLKLQEFRRIHKGISDEHTEKLERQIEKLEDRYNETRLALIKLREEQLKPFIEATFDNRFKVIDALHSNRLKQAQAYRTTLSSVHDIESKIAQSRLSQDRIEGLKFDIETTEDEMMKRALIATTQKELNKLKDLEIDKTISILNLETEILNTRREQTKEALRAIGTLDEEGKLRLLAQAQYFQRNPNAKITAEQIFHMTPETAGTLNQFWSGRVATLEEQEDSPFVDFLMQSGLGITPELVQGAKDYQRITGGMSREEIARRRMQAATQYEQSERIAGGHDLLNYENWDFEKMAIDLHVANQVVDLVVDKNSFSLEPLIGVFNDFLENTVKSEFERLFRLARETEDRFKPRIRREGN